MRAGNRTAVKLTRAAAGTMALLLAVSIAFAGWSEQAGAKKRHKHRSRVAKINCAGTNSAMSGMSLDQVSAAVTCLINRERASKGLRTVRSQAQLRGAAQAHNADMQQNLHAFTHAASNGDSLEQRIGRSGYMRKAKRWMIGEILDNVQSSAATPTDALDAWLQSPSHDRVMHIGKFRDVGVATSRGTAENPNAAGVLITVDFGYRKR